MEYPSNGIQTLSVEERIRLIEESSSMAELPPSVLPSSHRESSAFS